MKSILIIVFKKKSKLKILYVIFSKLYSMIYWEGQSIYQSIDDTLYIYIYICNIVFMKFIHDFSIEWVRLENDDKLFWFHSLSFSIRYNYDDYLYEVYRANQRISIWIWMTENILKHVWDRYEENKYKDFLLFIQFIFIFEIFTFTDDSRRILTLSLIRSHIIYAHEIRYFDTLF